MESLRGDKDKGYLYPYSFGSGSVALIQFSLFNNYSYFLRLLQPGFLHLKQFDRKERCGDTFYAKANYRAHFIIKKPVGSDKGLILRPNPDTNSGLMETITSKTKQ